VRGSPRPARSKSVTTAWPACCRRSAPHPEDLPTVMRPSATARPARCPSWNENPTVGGRRTLSWTRVAGRSGRSCTGSWRTRSTSRRHRPTSPRRPRGPKMAPLCLRLESTRVRSTTTSAGAPSRPNCWSSGSTTGPGSGRDRRRQDDPQRSLATLIDYAFDSAPGRAAILAWSHSDQESPVQTTVDEQRYRVTYDNPGAPARRCGEAAAWPGCHLRPDRTTDPAAAQVCPPSSARWTWCTSELVEPRRTVFWVSV
jgi:hypothetical protein